jgi:hypothetical protein
MPSQVTSQLLKIYGFNQAQVCHHLKVLKNSKCWFKINFFINYGKTNVFGTVPSRCLI